MGRSGDLAQDDFDPESIPGWIQQILLSISLSPAEEYGKYGAYFFPFDFSDNQVSGKSSQVIPIRTMSIFFISKSMLFTCNTIADILGYQGKPRGVKVF
jgi:hypothetical protein